MYESNYTFEEIATAIEQYGTERERDIVRRAQESIDLCNEELASAKQDKIRFEIMENSVYAVNTELAKAVRDLVIDLVEAIGDKRKSRESLNQFRNRYEDVMLPDEAEMLAEFADIVGKALD